jgi:hypothetical protein
VAKKIIKCVISCFLSLGVMLAQEAKPLPRHPGDVIKYEIRFDGPNADKIKQVLGSLGIRGAIPKDQSGFDGSFSTAGWIGPSSPGTFRIEFTIPSNIATGDYALANVNARADEGAAGYQNGQEFTVPPIHIENPKTFSPPGIKVTPLP